MKRIIKLILLLVLVCIIVLSGFACNTISNKTRSLNNVSYTPNKGRGLEEKTSEKMSLSAYKIYDILKDEANGENFVISPLSIYMAFALLDYIGDEGVKEEVSGFLGLDEEDILNAGKVFEYIVRTRKDEYGKTISKVDLTNSIWMDTDQGYTYNQEVLDKMAELLYCYAYETPFLKDNKTANNDIRKFVKNNTNGLIDRDFDLKKETLFALINTLYFKDNWRSNGNDLITEKKTFYLDSQEILCEFLNGEYVSGIAAVNDIASTMYSNTAMGYRLHFILPNEGHTLSEAMSYDNLSNLMFLSHTPVYEISEKNYSYFTRVIFPTFNVKSSVDMKDVLMKKNMFNHTFTFYESDLVDTPLSVSQVIHDAILKVDKKGIEGAAVTIIANKAESAEIPLEIIYYDYLVDKPFGFVLSTYDGVVLFMGEINNPTK